MNKTKELEEEIKLLRKTNKRLQEQLTFYRNKQIELQHLLIGISCNINRVVERHEKQEDRMLDKQNKGSP